MIISIYLFVDGIPLTDCKSVIIMVTINVIQTHSWFPYNRDFLIWLSILNLHFMIFESKTHPKTYNSLFWQRDYPNVPDRIESNPMHTDTLLTRSHIEFQMIHIRYQSRTQWPMISIVRLKLTNHRSKKRRFGIPLGRSNLQKVWFL